MNRVEKIAFDDLIVPFKVIYKEAFINYLFEIWKDLSRRSIDKIQGINNLIFAKYYELPGIISDRLFAVFETSAKGSLNLNDFLKGMNTLFSDDFEELIKFIFNFYDFNKDSFITRDDVRVVLSYVPVKSRLSPELCLKYETDDFIDRVEAQDELFGLLNKTFEDKAKLSKEEFTDVIYNKCSDAFVFILLFLLENRPFTNQTIQVYRKHSSFSYASYTPMTKINITSPLIQHIIVSPSTMKKLDSPTLQFTMRMQDKENTSPNNPIKLINALKGKSPISRNRRNNNNNELSNDLLPNESSAHLPNWKKKKIVINLQEDNRYSQKHNSNRKMSNPLMTEINLQDIEESNEGLSNIDNKEISYEGYIFKICKNNKLKRLWLKLVYKDLYIFNDKNDFLHKNLHNLSGVYINADPPLVYGDQNYYSFSIKYPKKTNTYYLETEKEYSNWMKHLRKASNIECLSDSYEIKEVIGKGKFGLVKLGIHKKTQRKVAIKIMNKKDMSPEDFKLAKTEIDILKISQHPNIIKLYDVIESPDAIYISTNSGYNDIVMEYCSGGDLFAYIETRSYKLPEKQVAEIIHKLSAVIYFIHSYGIVHRDLKPENILMTDTTDSADIRLLDFGLSKIIGPKETCKEPYGTMVNIIIII